MADRARILIQVVAGMIPDRPEETFSRTWAITSDMYYVQGAWEGKEAEAQKEMRRLHEEAVDYMKSLCDPRVVNWVSLDWIYF